MIQIYKRIMIFENPAYAWCAKNNYSQNEIIMYLIKINKYLPKYKFILYLCVFELFCCENDFFLEKKQKSYPFINDPDFSFV